MKNNSLTRVFRTSSGKYYAYDGITGKILTISPRLYTNSFEETRQNILSYLEENHIVSLGKFEKVAWGCDFEQYIELINHSIVNLMLQVTSGCNLNCKYCLYSGKYFHMEPRSNRNMSETTMIKAIDFFAGHNTEASEAVIDFYGGEPLLCFDLLKKAVVYAREKITGKPLSFRITSNGVLLNEQAAVWLRDNSDIKITVTLNGPFHDLYRVTASGEGSLKSIMKNISVLKEKYPKVWENQIKFFANISDINDLPELIKFYKKEIGKPPDNITEIRLQNGNEEIRKTVGSAKERQRSESKMWRQIGDEYGKTGDSYIYPWLRDGMINIENRAILSDCTTGTIRSCLPGLGKLYVFTDGKFGLCESACDKLHTGDIERGFYTDVLKNIYERGNMLYGEKCRNCPVQRLCRICLAQVLNSDGTLMETIPESTCDWMRGTVLRDLKIYCEIMDK